MKKELSQIELATLAAALPSGTATERVKLAFGIWFESDPVKAELAFWNDKLAAREAEWQEASATLIPFEKALEEIFPDEHPATQLDKFERFREWQRANGVEVPPLKAEKTIGVRFLPAIFDALKVWEASKKKAAATDKASIAAKARWNKPRATKPPQGKAAGKTQQVKKRAKS